MGDKEGMSRYEELVTRLDSLQEKLDKVEQLRVEELSRTLTDRYDGKLVLVEQRSTSNYVASYLVKSPKFHYMQGELSLQPSNYNAEDGAGKPIRVPDMVPLYSPVRVEEAGILVVSQKHLNEQLEYFADKKKAEDSNYQSILKYIEAYVEEEAISYTEWASSQEDSDEDTEKAEKGFQEALPAINDPSQTPVVVSNILASNIEELEIAKEILAKLEEPRDLPFDGDTD